MVTRWPQKKPSNESAGQGCDDKAPETAPPGPREVRDGSRVQAGAVKPCAQPRSNSSLRVRRDCPSALMTSLAPVQRPIVKSAITLYGQPVDQVLLTSWGVYGHSLDNLDSGSHRSRRGAATTSGEHRPRETTLWPNATQSAISTG